MPVFALAAQGDLVAIEPQRPLALFAEADILKVERKSVVVQPCALGCGSLCAIAINVPMIALVKELIACAMSAV